MRSQIIFTLQWGPRHILEKQEYLPCNEEPNYIYLAMRTQTHTWKGTCTVLKSTLNILIPSPPSSLVVPFFVVGEALVYVRSIRTTIDVFNSFWIIVVVVVVIVVVVDVVVVIVVVVIVVVDTTNLPLKFG